MFDILGFIELKRDGGRHSGNDLRDFVNLVRDGCVPDYQISAWLMAAFLRGLDDGELAEFTKALALSGDVVTLPAGCRAVDKHSTGGVGDKTTLVAGPLAASCGLPVAKLSGRGLGFTGGTVDKLESIPGMNMRLDSDRFARQIGKIGIAMSGHSLKLAPAEGKFYTLRGVTGTVPSIPLIASSIVSKKISGGANAFVFDVKCGLGAFMRTEESASELASALVSLSNALGKKSSCVVSDMEQPLGRWAGNSVEVMEALRVLSGDGPDDTASLSLTLASMMLVAGGVARDLDAASALASKKLSSGEALAKFEEMVSSQGGDASVCANPERVLPRAVGEKTIFSPGDGFIGRMDALAVGHAVRALGGGRVRGGDRIDPSVGVGTLKKIGDAVSKGEPIFEIRYNDEKRLEAALPHIAQAFSVVGGAERRPLILGKAACQDAR
ncbi:MAG: thymidine phosphorylase [Synergistaceae bacterium]|jgi:pyrimidine-nucleoside phosphorylase|nr:thymidine phosphorylase [Synergistaceae bacterium]